jgi:hypothetical protein
MRIFGSLPLLVALFFLQSPTSEAQSSASCDAETPLSSYGSCRAESEVACCNDISCMQRICDSLDQPNCCEDSWSAECVSLAAGVCDPEIFEK